MRDLDRKREEQPGEEEWTMLVLSVIASTLVQLPRAFVAMPRRQVKTLVHKCYYVIRQYLVKDFEVCSVNRRE